MIPLPRIPLLFVVSAPSGAGKTTLCQRLLSEFASTLCYSVSCTTRPPREGEVDGRDYHFIPRDQFAEYVEQDAFLEYAEVHGQAYGTLKQDVLDLLSEGWDVLMDIDVQGAESIRRAVHSDAMQTIRFSYVDVFIAPPSLADLEARLRGRGKDSDEVIRHRLSNAEAEAASWPHYQYALVNQKLDETYHRFRAIFLAEHQRVSVS